MVKSNDVINHFSICLALCLCLNNFVFFTCQISIFVKINPRFDIGIKRTNLSLSNFIQSSKKIMSFFTTQRNEQISNLFQQKYQLALSFEIHKFSKFLRLPQLQSRTSCLQLHTFKYGPKLQIISTLLYTELFRYVRCGRVMADIYCLCQIQKDLTNTVKDLTNGQHTKTRQHHNST